MTQVKQLQISHRQYAKVHWPMNKDIILSSTITCPHCAHCAMETMPTDACQWFYQCLGCGELLKPLKGDCCVFCSYGSHPCPPIQLDDGACCSA